MRYILIIFQILLFALRLCGQDSKIKKMHLGLICGYTWQGTHNIDFGLQPMLLFDARRDHSNLGLLITGNLMHVNKATYFTPTTKIRIMPHKRKKFVHLAWFASVGHCYTKILNKYDHRLTTEIGVKWEWHNLSVGYNWPVSGYRDRYTTLLRLSFSRNLF